VIVNVQGDEPEISPDVIDRLVARSRTPRGRCRDGGGPDPRRDSVSGPERGEGRAEPTRRGALLLPFPLPGRKATDPSPIAAGSGSTSASTRIAEPLSSASSLYPLAPRTGRVSRTTPPPRGRRDVRRDRNSGSPPWNRHAFRLC
jgi:hypothetical protein